MNRAERPSFLVMLSLIAIGVIFLFENILKAGENGTLLFTILFWSTLAQGCVALVAAAEIARGAWIQPIKKELLAFYPMILVLAVLFLMLSVKLDHIYPWIKSQGLWLNRTFFVARNGFMFFITFYLAHLFSKESINEGKSKGTYAVMYLFSFIVSQSLIAFDLIMSIEYPWYSTLFGAYTFIEAIYAGIAIGGVITFNLLRGNPASSAYRRVLVDIATMTFGFSLLWAGLFYSQFLVIWYGNLSEEISFLLRRAENTSFKLMGYSVIFMLFVLPFVILLSREIKKRGTIVLIAVTIVLAGIFIERLLYLLPHLNINPVVVIVEFIALGLLFVNLNTNKDLFLR
jgi:hypothetical protein